MEDYQPLGHDDEAAESVASDRCARRSRRDSLYLAATVRLRGSEVEHTIRIRNLSAGGMLADDMPPCERGDAVIVSVGRIGEVAGQVAWIDPDKAGVAFDEPIDPRLARRPIAVRSRKPRPAATEVRTRRSGLRVE